MSCTINKMSQICFLAQPFSFILYILPRATALGPCRHRHLSQTLDLCLNRNNFLWVQRLFLPTTNIETSVWLHECWRNFRVGCTRIFSFAALQVARMSCFPTSQAIVVGGGLGGAVWTGWTCGGHRETSWNHRCFLRWKVCQQPTLSLRTVAELFCWLLGSKVTWESKWQRSLLT